MNSPYEVTADRLFSKLEKQMIWQKPESHQDSEEELRIASEIKENWHDPEMKIFNVLLEGDAGSGKTQLAKALSFDLQLPYTKVTCFADMDKSDVFGALLPIVATDDALDGELLEAIYQTERLEDLLQLIQTYYQLTPSAAREKLAALIERIDKQDSQEVVHYKFYPSEIVRALEKGYLLEIQEPTVIRDASVLVALNSALEHHGMLNLPTGMVRRHGDCVIVITTNRNYQGNRPLNESLRDRMQHAEKMDLPAIEVMVQRGKAKTGYGDEAILTKMAEIIRLLDTTAKANAIKGVAGMRSYFYWVHTLVQDQDPLQTIYPKVLYKVTTDPNELTLLQNALAESELLDQLRQLLTSQPLIKYKKEAVRGRKISQEEADQRNIPESEETEAASQLTSTPLTETEDEKILSTPEKQPNLSDDTKRTDTDGKSESGSESSEESFSESTSSVDKIDEKQFQKTLNKEARSLLKETSHGKEGLIIHRPKSSIHNQEKARQLTGSVLSIVEPLVKQIQEILENEETTTYQKGKYMGTRFDASRVAYGDYRTFDKKQPPHEVPSLALALRIDESGSMIREDRITTALTAAIAVTEFARQLNLPLMIYGDTADLSAREKTSIYSYKEFEDSFDGVAGKLVSMKARQNNRDGVPLKLLSDKLVQQTATTKLVISISDGQPKALPDYTGKKAILDIQNVVKEYERQGIRYLAAAIGEDKEKIKEIYGEHRFLDISDLKSFPEQLIQLIARYI
ncbi:MULTISPECIES: AAA family ATPase [Enterococcus]|uniref:AAA family ATPase n=1 Tax=Enterococcus TaxID=1350 RepID=UPI0010F48DD0|nr:MULTISPECIES: AAA family ATPase [Enterococcus]KAF1302518.1 hypothetical protein BAU16_06785 [Enterococcus sp. JM9B]